MKSSTIIVSVAALIACGATLAKADSAYELRSVTVQYADLDTADSPGAATLYRRLKNASESVCQDLQSGKELSRQRAYINCVHAALSNAILQVNRPALNAYAAAHGLPAAATIRIANNK